MSQENVFKAHLWRQMEVTDRIVKKLVGEVAKGTIPGDPKVDIQSILKALRDQSAEFWARSEDVDSIISIWFQYVAQSLKSHIPCDLLDLKERIWQTFLRRLSLDPWLIFRTSKLQNFPPQGNCLVQMMIDSIENTIYRQFPLSLPVAAVPAPAPTPAFEMPTSRLYGDLLAPGLPDPPAFKPSLERIPEHDPLESEFGMKIRYPRTAQTTANPNAGGFQVRLKRTAAQQRRPKKSQAKDSESDGSSSESEPDTREEYKTPF